jgi:tetratricopeptide (TPR) repeat protein
VPLIGPGGAICYCLRGQAAQDVASTSPSPFLVFGCNILASEDAWNWGLVQKAMANCWVRKSAVGVALGLVLAVSPARADQCGATPYDCAFYYIRQHQFSLAIPLLNQILHRSPRDLRALNLLGIALTESGQIEKANRQFKKALKYDPHFYPALKNLAINELNAKKREQAKTHFEQVLRYVPADEIANLFLGEIYFAEKDCAGALKHYEKSRTRIVNDRDLILHYSECALAQGQKGQAILMLDVLPDAASRFQAGMMLAQSGFYADAARYFGLARERSSDPDTAGYNQTLMYIKAKDYTAAIQTAKDLLTQGYKGSDMYSLLSEAYLKNGQVQEAYDALRKATEIDPRYENNYVDLAAICIDYKNYDLGIEISDIGLRYIPNSDRLVFQRGVMRAMKGQLVQGEEDFRLASRLAPQKALPYVALGIDLMQRGELQKAIEVLRERARLNQNEFMTPYLYGEALTRAGIEPGSPAEKEAIEALETSIRLNPNFAHSRGELGKILLKRGDVKRAIEELEKAVSIDPTDAAAVNQLGHAYRKNGDAARAQKMFALVSKLDKQERETYSDTDLKRIVREGVVPFSSNQTKP